MSVVYILDSKTKLSQVSERIVVERNGEIVTQIPMFRVEAVFVYGNAQLSVPVMAQLTSHGIAVAYFSVYGRFRARVSGPLDRSQALRAAQYHATSDPAMCILAGTQIIRAKIENQRAVLQYAAWHHRDLDLKEELHVLEGLASKASESVDLEALMGCEGYAARRYFEGLGKLLAKSSIQFNGRSRRPPMDPFNAALSFGYANFRARLEGHLHGRGLDPYFGFLHSEHHNQPSLALDLMEPWRPYFVDRFALRMFNLGILKADDFRCSPTDGFFFEEPAMRRWFEHWEAFWNKTGCREKIHDQVESVCNFFRNPAAVMVHPRFTPK